MAGRSKYSDSDRARVNQTLAINDGNIKRTARETGVPIATVRDWKREWEENGVPVAVQDAQVDTLNEFVTQGTRVRNAAMDRLQELIPEAKSVRELATVVGIMDDKIVRAKGLPTNRTEHVSAGLPSPAEVRSLIGEWMADTPAPQRERDADIIEVTDAVLVEPAPALNPGVKEPT